MVSIGAFPSTRSGHALIFYLRAHLLQALRHACLHGLLSKGGTTAVNNTIFSHLAVAVCIRLVTAASCVADDALFSLSSLVVPHRATHTLGTLTWFSRGRIDLLFNMRTSKFLYTPCVTTGEFVALIIGVRVRGGDGTRKKTLAKYQGQQGCSWWRPAIDKSKSRVRRGADGEASLAYGPPDPPLTANLPAVLLAAPDYAHFRPAPFRQQVDCLCLRTHVISPAPQASKRLRTHHLQQYCGARCGEIEAG